MKRVVVGASTFAVADDAALRFLEEKNIEVAKNPFERRLTKEETIRHLEGADGILAGLEILDEEVFQAAPQLKAIARIGIGMDNVDQEAAKRHGIKVSNTPDAPTASVAEMALAALLSMIHEIIPANADLHQKVWKKRLGLSVQGLQVLLIGYGRIGRLFGEHLKALGADLLIYDPLLPELSEPDLLTALSKADVVSLHASGKEEILTEESFSSMKEGAVLLNCARGALLDENALIKNLKNGHVRYYWGDVFPEEPYTGLLTELDNAILTPHLSSNTAQCRKAMEMEAAQNIVRDLGL